MKKIEIALQLQKDKIDSEKDVSKKNVPEECMISESPVIRIVKKAGAERISESARNFIMNELKRFSFFVAKESVVQTEAKGKEKITASEVMGASSRFYSNITGPLEKEQMLELSIAPFQRVLKKTGTARISQKARLNLAKYVQAYAHEVAKEANRLRAHSGITLKRIDILEAEKNLKDRKMLFYGGKSSNLLKLGSGLVSVEKFIISKDGERIQIENAVLEESKLELHIQPITPPITQHIAEDKTQKNDQKCEFSVTLAREKSGCVESINYGSTKEGRICITCPQFENLDRPEIFPSDALFTLTISSQLGNASLNMLILPKGYSKESLSKIFQISLKKEFGGIEKEFGNLKIDEKKKKEIISKMRHLAKEYDSIIAYECARRELAIIAKNS